MRSIQGFERMYGAEYALDDGRVLSVETVRSKEFPVSFYVIPFEGEAQADTIEALDEEGNVLDRMALRRRP